MRIFGTMVVLMLCSGAVAVQAQEKKLDRSSLPTPVSATLDRETKGSIVKGYATERENGQKVYEAETIVNGHTRDLQVAEDGTLNEVEEEIAFDQLSTPVQSGLKAQAKGASITKVEALTKRGKLVAYEATTRKGSHKGEVQVGPNGGLLSHNE